MDNLRSNIYNHFNILPDKRKQCKYCQNLNKEQIYSSTSPTTPLWAHLKKHHSEQLNDKLPGVTLTVIQKKAITNAYIRWIIYSCQPFTTSDDPEFREFVQLLNEGYTVPCRQTTQKLVMEKFSQFKTIIQDILQKTPGDISLTCDIWTSTAMDSYLGITVHFIDNKWRLQNFTLDIQLLPHPHTGAAIKDALLMVINEFGIQHKILALVTDNGSNMIRGFNLLAAEILDKSNHRIHHIRCGAHTLNLVAQEGFKSMFTMEQNPQEDNPTSPLSKLRLCVNAIRRSPKAIDNLKKYCQAGDIKYHSLSADCPTRWSSTYTMIKSSLEQKQALQALFSSSDVKNIKNALDHKEWDVLKSRMNYLEIFDGATNVLSTFLEPTIYLTGQVFTLIKQRLITDGTDTAKIMVDKLEEYIPKLSDAHWLSSALHPGIKLNQFDKRDKTKIIELKKLAHKISEDIDKISQGSPDIPTNSSYKRRMTTFKKFQAIVDGTIVVDGRAPTQLLDPEAEIKTYLTNGKAEEDCDILIWWKDHKKDYPVLATLAQNYFAIPASSVPCEQLFSIAGNTITKTRNSLAPDTAQALLCLRSWISFTKNFVE